MTLRPGAFLAQAVFVTPPGSGQPMPAVVVSPGLTVIEARHILGTDDSAAHSQGRSASIVSLKLVCVGVYL
jgi:hypothetical protein